MAAKAGHDVDRVLVTKTRVDSPTIRRARAWFCRGSKRANNLCPYARTYPPSIIVILLLFIRYIVALSLPHGRLLLDDSAGG